MPAAGGLALSRRRTSRADRGRGGRRPAPVAQCRRRMAGGTRWPSTATRSPCSRCGWSSRWQGCKVLSAWALAVLNSHRRFFLPYVAPVLWNLSIIATLGGGRGGGSAVRRPSPLAKSELLYAAAVVALVGGALQLAIQLPTVLRLLGGLAALRTVRARPACATHSAPSRRWWRDAGRAAALGLPGLRAGRVVGRRGRRVDVSLRLRTLPAGGALRHLEAVTRAARGVAAAHRRGAGHSQCEWAWRQISFLSLPAVVGFLASALARPALIARCAHLVRIPTAFSLNVATAGAIVMYDRLRCLGRFASRPVAVGGAPEARAEHVRGAPRRRTRGV